MADSPSPRPPDGAVPEPGEVWTWWLDLDVGEPAASQQARLLDATERRRADHRSGDQRTRFIAARAALRTILGSCLAIPPEKVGFRYGDCGRPDLASSLAMGGLRFNISHSGPLGLVAVVLDQRIGVDVERLRPVRHLDRIVARVFGERDRSRLLALPPSALETEFFDSWTRKEAVVKALGTGIFRSLDRPATEHASLPAAHAESPTTTDPTDAALAAGGWTLVSPKPPVEGYAASVAVDHPAVRVTDRTQPPDR